MSKSVDTRVVQMQFDNTQFERNIGTSINSLNKLQDSLDMKGAAKSFKALDEESQKVSLSGISNAVESVTHKFSVLETVAFSAVKNITDRAVDAGISLAKSLSVDQITAGWGKLNEETSSVQTIMNATGKSLEEVEGYLQKLMWFSDETSYGFTDMTAALGQLTASGADIDAMIPMITGIANATAYAGKGAGEFQRSIYNLTQSFGSGHLQLMDWKSLENAGTATAQLKQTLIDTAVELGKLEKVGDKVYVSVSGSSESADELNSKLTALDEKYADKKKTLNEKLNSELENLQKKYYRKVTSEQYEDLERQLRAKYNFAAIEEDLEKEKAKVREKYSGSTNTSGKTEVDVGTFGTTLSEGWADTEVMTKAFAKFSELSDAAYEAVNAGEYETAADAIEALSEKYDDLSVKAFKAAQTSKSFSDAIDATKDAVSSGWMTTFKIIVGNLEEQQVLWTELTGRLWDVFASGAEDRNEVLKEWKELGGRDDLVESLWNAWDAVGSVIEPIKDAFKDIFPKATGEQLAKITRNLKELTAKMTLSESQAEKVKATFKGVFAVLDIGLSAIKAVAGGVLSLAKNLSGIPNLVLNASSALGKWSSGLRDSVKETNIFGKAVDAVVGVIQKANGKIGDFASAAKAKFDATGFTDFLGILKAVYNFALKAGKVVIGLGASIGTALMTAFKNGGIRGVIDVINTGLFGAVLISAKNFIDGLSDAFGGVTDILEGVSGVLEGVKGSLEAWQKSLNAEILSKIAKAIAILAISLAVVASIDRERLTST